MKAVGREFDLQKIDITREFVVDRTQEVRGVGLAGEIDMGHLVDRVDARVGPSRPVDLNHSLAGGAVDRLHDFAGHRARVGLKLPAAVAGSEILEIDAISEAVSRT